MSIFVYADESGVFDHLHNDYFVFGGILLYSKNQRDIMGRKYGLSNILCVFFRACWGGLVACPAFADV
ncbi:hypothetical protein [Varibaculum cambriense]|uniref:hypothetical protein n=1 Tax=Varibaculum cambriense TaxID=184870 RepID=UPI0028FEDC62|nr:hypothetical protein [Varibaculum cambriense]MDU1224784.1 hypothetical protein [Varibaculum cambriense]